MHLSAHNVHSRYTYEVSEPDQYIPMPTADELLEECWISGFFFNAKCMLCQ
jgi:hypothetical protein